MDSEEGSSVPEQVDVNPLTLSLSNNVLTQDADLPGSFLSSLSLLTLIVCLKTKELRVLIHILLSTNNMLLHETVHCDILYLF